MSEKNTESTAPNRSIARFLAFGLTWVSYASYYLGRKALSVTKIAIEKDLGPRALVGVDTVYLAMYALGQPLSGWLGDRIGARKLITTGMLVSGLACLAFGASSFGTLLLLCYAINGISQSTGWPGNVKAMASWTTAEDRGRVMGIWSTCYQVGGIVATGIATRLATNYGWRYAYWGPAVLLMLVGLAIWLGLKDGPYNQVKSRDHADFVEQERKKQKAVLQNKTVWLYGACYFCIKLIRYSLLFWLPYYLVHVLHYSEADAGYFSTSFEIGGIAGTIGIGLLSDRYRAIPRSIFAAVSLVGLAASIYVYAHIGHVGPMINFVSMALVGALLFGPDALLAGAASQDLGGAEAAALAAGVINGIGSVGAILQEFVTRGVSSRWGWNALFYVFLVLALMAAMCLIPTFRTPNSPAEQKE